MMMTTTTMMMTTTMVMNTGIVGTFTCLCLILQFLGADGLGIQEEGGRQSSLLLPRVTSVSRPPIRQKRAALADPRKLWDNATIPYDIDPILPDYSITILKLSMREWEKVTCLSFVPKSPTDVNFVHFTRTDCGCCTPVGNKRNGSQFFSISPNCSQLGNIMHELGHTVGFYHEQSRPDRDKYVRIHYDNIDKHLHHNFKLYKDLDSLGEPYDFDSIMHYPLIYPARGGKTIMTVIDDQVRHSYSKVGQRSILSPGDIRQTNKLYKCPECGQTLVKSEGSFDVRGDKLNEKFETKKFFERKFCQWRIIASRSDIVEVKVTRARIPRNVNCSSYLEIRDGYYNSPTLVKMCGAVVKKPRTIRSTGPRMFVQLNISPGARYWTPGLIVEFRTIAFTKLEGESGNFSSPGFPGFYPFLRLCHFLIRTPEKTFIRLHFHAVEIGKDDLCQDEFIEVRDGDSEQSKSLGKFCGNRSGVAFSSNSNSLLVVFKSHTSTNLRGFTACYHAESMRNIKRKPKNPGRRRLLLGLPKEPRTSSREPPERAETTAKKKKTEDSKKDEAPPV